MNADSDLNAYTDKYFLLCLLSLGLRDFNICHLMKFINDNVNK